MNIPEHILNRPWRKLAVEVENEKPGVVYIGNGDREFPLVNLFGAGLVWGKYADIQSCGAYNGSQPTMQYYTTQKNWNEKVIPLLRPWKELKKEKAGLFPGFVYIGTGDRLFPLYDLFDGEIYRKNDLCDKLSPGWMGNTTNFEYYTTEEKWNERIMSTTVTNTLTVSPTSENLPTEIYQKFHSTIKKHVVAAFAVPSTSGEEDGQQTYNLRPAVFYRKGGVRGMFVARKNNKGEVVVGYSLCNPKDSFNKTEGLNIARRRCVPLANMTVDFGPGKQYEKDWVKFIERVSQYFKLNK